MNGNNKQTLSGEQLNEILNNVYGCTAVQMEELKDGWANTAYRLRMTDGANLIMKISPRSATKLMRYEYELMKTEIEVLQMLDQINQIPVPKVLAYDRSRTMIDGEYFIMEQLAGQPYNQVKENMSTNERAAIEQQLGALARALHDIKGTGFGHYCDPMNEHMTWREVFLMLINSVLDDGEEAGMKLSMPYDELRHMISSKSICMNEVTEPSLVHWDLWDGNFFVKDGSITGIIDFERALWADPLFEHYFSNTGLDTSSFIRGYGRYEQLTRSEQQRIACYKLYLALIMYVECHYRGYTNEEHIEWAKRNMEQGIASFSNDLEK